MLTFSPRENTSYSVTTYALNQLLYPTSGYKSETGGRLAELRSSCSHSKVAAYHRRFYRPSGVRLLVAGDVPPERLLAALEGVHASVAAKGASFWPAADDGGRAWATPAPPMERSASIEVEFPSGDEENGVVRAGWLTSAFGDAYTRSALHVLLEYLTDTSVSELQMALVECDPPLACAVYGSIDEAQPVCVTLTADGVPTAKLRDALPALHAALRAFATGTSPFDGRRMASTVARARLSALDAAESRPEDVLSSAAIPAFVHAPGGEAGAAALRDALNAIPRLDRLASEPPSFWTDLCDRTLGALV